MKDPYKRRYLYLMLAIFGGISLSILVFFAVFRFQGLGAAISSLGDLLAPFIYGSVVAYLLRPVCNCYERLFQNHFPKQLQKAASSFAVGLSLITGLLAVYVLIIMIVPNVYNSVHSLWISLPDKVNQFLAWARGVFGEDEALLRVFNEIYNYAYSSVEHWADNTLTPYITSVVNIVTGVGTGIYKVARFLYNVLIGLIVACYLLAGRKKLACQAVLIVRSTLKPKWADAVLREVAFMDRMFGGFIDGKILDSAIMGVLCYLGCVIFRFPNALMVSAIVGVTNVIPFFGPFIGGVPATLLIMIDNPIKGLWFIVFILALQQLDGNLIGPAILGDRTGLSSFWVLFAIILCGGLWGIFGMVVCVPAFAVLFDILEKLIRRGLSRNGQIELWEKYQADYPEEVPKGRKK